MSRQAAPVSTLRRLIIAAAPRPPLGTAICQSGIFDSRRAPCGNVPDVPKLPARGSSTGWVAAIAPGILSCESDSTVRWAPARIVTVRISYA